MFHLLKNVLWKDLATYSFGKPTPSTVCFFAIVTKDDGITQPNDFTPMSAINRLEVYCLAFVLVRSKVFSNDF